MLAVRGEDAMSETRRWTIYTCPVHPEAVRSLDSPPPGERPYCPHAKHEDPHKMQATEVTEVGPDERIRQQLSPEDSA
jgi:hypothetical protein